MTLITRIDVKKVSYFTQHCTNSVCTIVREMHEKWDKQTITNDILLRGEDVNAIYNNCEQVMHKLREQTGY